MLSISAGQNVRTLKPELAFALGRLAKDEEQIDVAETFLRAALATPDPKVRSRAQAHLAHLHYYRGLFVEGLELATRALTGAAGLARLEANLYASVNAIALNRSAQALLLAERARRLLRTVMDRVLRDDARLRVSRQLVHVYVARGEYLRATAEAEAATGAARRLGSERALGTAAYLRGYAAWARGDPAATAHLQRAAILWGGRHRHFGRWVQFVWALALRDAGEARAARGMQGVSGITLAWEEPLFALALGQPTETPAMTDPSADELPFHQAARGVMLLAKDDLEGAAQEFARAAVEFERCELDHYRRGAMMGLAATHLQRGERERAVAILRRETPALIRFGLRRWPWWHGRSVAALARLAVANSIGAGHWAILARTTAEPPSLSSLLAALGLTPRESEAVSTWLDHPDWSRRRLSQALGITEASARNHLGRARQKLGVVRDRGAESLRGRLLQIQDSAGSRFL